MAQSRSPGPGFFLQVLPARHGDCIWLEYGPKVRPRRVLIDAGPTRGSEPLFAKIGRLKAMQRRFELVVITHIDADHIEGAIQLLHRYETLKLNVGDVWFNGWPQLESLIDCSEVSIAQETRGPAAGGYAGLKLEALSLPWNKAFGGAAAVVSDGGPLPALRLPGGLTLTLLSPTRAGLEALQLEWQRAFDRQGVPVNDEAFLREKFDGRSRFRSAAPPEDGPGREAPFAAVEWSLDASVANESSIAFIAEYKGVRCALFADAHAPVLVSSLRRFARERNERRVRLAAAKLSHHGSKANISNALLDCLDCHNFVVSTDGSVFNHPDDDAIARLAERARPLRLFFNHANERTLRWEASNGEQVSHLEKGSYDSVYPVDAGAGVVLDLLSLNLRR